MRRPSKRLLKICVHEAAHAVIHHRVFGHTVEYITVRPNYRRNAAGRTQLTYRGYWYKSAIIVGFAGLWAEQLFLDTALNVSGSGEDFDEIKRILDKYFPELDDSQRAALRAELKEKSREMVIANESNIRTVAAYLMAWALGQLAWRQGGHRTSQSLGGLSVRRLHSYGQTATEILNHLIDSGR